MKLNMPAFALPLHLADERQRHPAHAKAPAIVLNPANRPESALIKDQVRAKHPAWGFDQANAAVISEHFRMHAGKMSRVLQRK
jgi:hypothetical protein